MKKYYLTATFRLKSLRDFRKYKEIRANGKRLLIVSRERLINLTGAPVVLMGRDNRSYE